MKLIVNKLRLRSVVFAIVLFSLFAVYPFVFSQFVPFLNIKLASAISILILIVLCVIVKQLKALPLVFNQIWIIQVALWLILFVVHSDSTYLTRIFFLVETYLIIICLNSVDRGCFKFIKIYDKIILAMCLFGAISFFLVLLFNINPISEYQNVDGRTGYFYGLTCTPAKFGYVIRYAGFFDEPGAIAFWGMYVLLINRLFIHNHSVEKWLSMALIFTFSIAFYIQYVFYYLLLKRKTQKQVVSVIILMTILVAATYYTKDTEYNLIYEFTFKRLEYDKSSGTISGDNRSDLASNAKKVFVESPIIGAGPSIITKVSDMADNPYENLATDGILGTIIIYLPLIIVAAYSKNKNIVFAIFILALGYLQRPFHSNLLHPFMMYLFSLISIDYISKRKQDDNKGVYYNSSVQFS